MYANEQRHRCCVFFEYECVRILCSEFQQMKLKKRNTYGVVSHATYKPRVACTIVWQPWAIKNTTPTALKHVFFDAISFVLQHDLVACHAEIAIIYDVDSNNL